MFRISVVPQIALWGFCLMLWTDVASAQGFRLERQRLTVARSQDWNQWGLGELQEPLGEVRQDVIEVTPEGRILPRLIRKNIDAVSDAPTFRHFIEGKVESFYINTFKDGSDLFARGGIKDAGSNVNQADNVIDREADRFESFWEPDLDRPKSEWWVEIDLGRVVSAEKVALRFVDEALGDPFLQFKVLVSDGEFAFGNRETLNYRIIGGTTQGVKDQRVFEYILKPDQKAEPDYTGAPIQYVRIVVTDTNKDRAKEITQEEYEALPVRERGAIEYNLKTFDDRQLQTSRTEFENVDPERQGTVRYYRQERPRLADVEVSSVGENLALGIRNRGGKIEVSGVEGHIPANAFDGDYRSFWKAQTFLEVGPGSDRGGLMTIDLGATFWIDTYRILPHRQLLGYISRVSNGATASDGSLLWEIVSPAEREINTASLRRFEDRIDARQVRFFEFKHIDGTGRSSGQYGAQYAIGEIQFFGQGYVPEVVLTSPLIELGGSRNMTRVEWVGDTPPGTRIEIRTQTGSELIPVKHFFDKGGKEVTRDKYYNQLASFQQGDSTLTFTAGVDWSPWSKAYENSGDALLSPSPRQFLKIQTRLLSDDPANFATLDSLIVHFTDPIARQLLAEVSPQIDVRRVEPDTFSVFLRSIFVDQPVSQRSPRFDEVRVVASQQTAMELLEVRLGGRDKLLAGEAEVFRVNGQAGLINDIGEVIEIIPTSADSLWIKLPRLVEKDADRDFVYQRIAQEGDEAPLDKQGNALTRREYSQLTSDEQGRIDYFQIIDVDDNGVLVLERVEETSYDNLPFAGQGPVRYYRRLFAGEEVELDNDGEPLTQSSYNSLSSSRRGTVLSEGEMVELRFRSSIFLNGTTFTTQVTNSTIPNAWQQVDPGDAMERIDGVGTSVFTPIDNRILHSLEITPNPFTPNGDGINDRLQLVLSVLKIDVARQIQAQFFTLAGVEVSRVNTTGVGGQQVLEWDGLDAAGTHVPPGLYLCHIWVDTDSGAQNELVRVVSVVY
jgi:hypothetical protein